MSLHFYALVLVIFIIICSTQPHFSMNLPCPKPLVNRLEYVSDHVLSPLGRIKNSQAIGLCYWA